ncbi:hypothetical protein E1301_Tti000720 [Triplophysa tibetana]|uniref:Uncharacterized protein n=1 Tax=Triplophysa tibetana TaxID=1572043 RepID=A0A5A9N716_9TELE|nr:hypothetical protein E1301_Tti000720 [Triplophysa tibetana]
MTAKACEPRSRTKSHSPSILLSDPDIKLLWPSRKLPLRSPSLSTGVSVASGAASARMHVIKMGLKESERLGHQLAIACSVWQQTAGDSAHMWTSHQCQRKDESGGQRSGPLQTYLSASLYNALASVLRKSREFQNACQERLARLSLDLRLVLPWVLPRVPIKGREEEILISPSV